MKMTDTSCKIIIIIIAIISTLAPFLPTFTIPGVTSLAKLTMQKDDNKRKIDAIIRYKTMRDFEWKHVIQSAQFEVNK